MLIYHKSSSRVLTRKARAFTLSDTLVALMLLGQVAAFTIPKLVSATAAVEAKAKVRETVQVLEQTWSRVKLEDSYVVDAPLYDSLASVMNTLRSGADSPSAVLGAGHPCQNLDGYLQFSGGTTIAGLGGTLEDGSTPTQRLLIEDLMPFDAANEPSNYLICIDTNGGNGPNQPGLDIFVGNFNQSGDFDGSAGTRFRYSGTSRNFYWGGPDAATQYVFSPGGTGGALTGTLSDVDGRAGNLLMR